MSGNREILSVAQYSSSDSIVRLLAGAESPRVSNKITKTKRMMNSTKSAGIDIDLPIAVSVPVRRTAFSKALPNNIPI